MRTETPTPVRPVVDDLEAYGCAWLNTEVCNRNFPGECPEHPRPVPSVELVDLAYALQGRYLVRITDSWQRDRVARGIRRNDLEALRFAFPAS